SLAAAAFSPTHLAGGGATSPNALHLAGDSCHPTGQSGPANSGTNSGGTISSEGHGVTKMFLVPYPFPVRRSPIPPFNQSEQSRTLYRVQNKVQRPKRPPAM